MTSTEPDDIECGQADEAPQRIRWQERGTGGWDGFAGTNWLFTIHPPARGRHTLFTDLPLASVRIRDADPDVLKATAERWLAEFVASLGAQFTEEV